MTGDDVEPTSKGKRGRRTAEPVEKPATRALVVVPVLGRFNATDDRTSAAKLEEARGLAAAIDLDVAAARLAPLNTLRPATYLGKGKVEEFAALVAEEHVGLVYIDASLTPVQQRNLEKALAAKVIDRTGLILEIFGRRARTKEGVLQVELAHLTYQKSRLVRSWTHLERQRGGFGFLGGPGETQIEADRRMIQERITRIERQLEGVTKTRRLHRAGRKRVPYPVVALVGYTNAGKSTLFNALTSGGVLAEDMLFATLDPTLRELRLPRGTRAILSDTVGFISNLPTMLVAAFRATLEEVLEADLVLHVRDVAHDDTDAQAADVTAILRDLGVDPTDRGRLLDVWNKIDLLDAEARAILVARAERLDDMDRPLLISATTGEGLPALLAAVEDRVSQRDERMNLTLGSQEGALVNWLHENADVESRRVDDDGAVHLTFRVSPQKKGALNRRLAARGAR